MLALTLLLILIFPSGLGLTVYDCDTAGTTFQMLSSLEPGSCPDPKKDYAPLRKWGIQILQTQQQGRISICQCLIS